jgi:hypothetical protein
VYESSRLAALAYNVAQEHLAEYRQRGSLLVSKETPKEALNEIFNRARLAADRAVSAVPPPDVGLSAYKERKKQEMLLIAHAKMATAAPSVARQVEAALSNNRVHFVPRKKKPVPPPPPTKTITTLMALGLVGAAASPAVAGAPADAVTADPSPSRAAATAVEAAAADLYLPKPTTAGLLQYPVDRSAYADLGKPVVTKKEAGGP